MGVLIGKWRLHQQMQEEKALSAYLPETRLLKEETLWELLNKFSQVMIKPCLGHRGTGVIGVSKKKKEKYELHAANKTFHLKGKKKTYEYMNEHYVTKKCQIVQQRISLAVIDGSPFDLRVMVQRKRNSAVWEVTGKLVKVAARGFIITNAIKGLLTVEEISERSSFDEKLVKALLLEIDQLALLAAIQLQKHYPQCRMIGFDIGIDENGRIWIIEANFKPDVSLFKKIDDLSMFKRIRLYQRG